ncbi:hypothetical protein C5E07_09540 [Pseudoclavibacter sp. RFBJ3]|uniref:hypothetical protein n=1 Tax=unclassified Pseudoclavibacter TaxID=2615177 RepID=UPI000CE75C84|nr:MULTISPECIES: hypothetical protein [unclassified Pseudoclavibacter]MBF4549903.1 hypothetical protein [Pseudoclavibacter sp. VKM Ac-2888]PPF38280.1 hypothetical protein C5E05_04510 [Pseudoclavibacter sp. AY1H1]PPF83730.1 hypothetical protein C5C12_08620 [Pseudoclavibacter sp. RFBJ5]PPF92010.1 hypothetical protein C5E07_09540 [Pseudoclavibacter sp. RFBJ3]PPF96873.1 hypothetical protein C5C19_12850 [Pseudoclavibacter sp. RFBH5]
MSETAQRDGASSEGQEPLDEADGPLRAWFAVAAIVVVSNFLFFYIGGLASLELMDFLQRDPSFPSNPYRQEALSMALGMGAVAAGLIVLSVWLAAVVGRGFRVPAWLAPGVVATALALHAVSWIVVAIVNGR